MKYFAPVAIWLYLIVTTVVEVLIFYRAPGTFAVDTAIGLIALVNALITAYFLMNIKQEPATIHYLFLAPLALVMVLILTLLFALAG
jgi:hypothetical protein